VRGPVLTVYRNGDDPYAAGQHRGVDIGAPVGARVVAATGGTISFAGTAGSSGLTVSERTADGRYDLSYLHLSAVAVHRGEVVAEGEPLGTAGVSGRRSATEPHLHFGVREAGARAAYRDPLDFLAPPPAADTPARAPAPVPVAAPAPTAPAAVADPVPAALPSLGPEVAPARPAAGRVPTPANVPLHARAGASWRTAPQGRVPAVGPKPIHPRAHGGSAPGAHGHASAQLAGAPTGPGPASASAPAPGQARPRGAHRAAGGPDLGWLAACLGLVIAAGVLGHPRRPRNGAARRRTALAALRRPAPRGG
jgi:pyruvate/2-oxoglutarate dehydrogenase complex dihydrolipoamide acyltransferase (E2) component